jgi:metal binding Ada-like protein
MQGEEHLEGGGLLRSYTLLGPDRRSFRSAHPGTLGGHRGTRIYGRLDCPSALRAIARGGYVKHRVFLRDEETAIAAGYRPCAVCCPQQYRAFRDAQRMCMDLQ